jgi:hypothetical protein
MGFWASLFSRKKSVIPVRHSQRPEVTRCAMCAASGLLYGWSDYEINWDEKKSRYVVRFVTCDGPVCKCCRYAHGHLQAEVVREIPVIIAKESACECGSKLRLGSHTLRSVNGQVEFEGVYVCPVCEKRKNTLVKKVGEGLSSLWQGTKKIEISATGMSYEKEASAK